MRMFKTWKLALLLGILAVTFDAAKVGAQEPTQSKLPSTPVQSVLQNWNEAGAQLLVMAQDWPEDKYGYKLTPEVRSFSQVLLHVGGANYELVNKIAGTKVGDQRNDPPAAEYKTKAQVVAFLKKSIEDGAAEIQKSGDAETLKNLYLWINYTEHMGEHYGLLVGYYRASGLVPPSSRKK
jgi:hypothetical protein